MAKQVDDGYVRVSWHSHLQSPICLICIIIMNCIGSGSGASVYCTEARSCMNQSYDGTDTLFVYGYKAAFGPLTSWAGDGLRCDGSFACNSMSSMNAKTDGLYCNGDESCSNTNARAARTVYCHASNSCSGANISAAGTAVHCNGFQSCANAYIHDTPSIEAGGQFALLNATIDTTDSVNMIITIRVDGSLAGYGAKLFCGAGYTCRIYCYGYDSCHMFYTDCVGTCSLTAYPDVIEPMSDLSAFNSQYVARDMEATMDESCMQNAVTLDDKGDFSHSTICTFGNTNLDIDITTAQERSVCCRGMCSCGLINMDMLTKTKQFVLCSAYQSCHQSVIAINNNTLYCEAKEGCTGSTIRADAVYCSGFEACYESMIYGPRFVECRGDRSCEHTSVISDGRSVDLFLTGHQAGWYLSLYCNDTDVCNVYCTGFEACSDINLFCNGNCNTIEPKPPTQSPSTDPTRTPSDTPTLSTSSPTKIPTEIPTVFPTEYPTRFPSKTPTEIPTVFPTEYPTRFPSKTPTEIPTVFPTEYPTRFPSKTPTEIPTVFPTFLTTLTPIATSLSPSATPTDIPTDKPTTFKIIIEDVASTDGAHYVEYFVGTMLVFVCCVCTQ
eukprot:918632_1